MRSLVFAGRSWAAYEQLRERDKRLHKNLCAILKEMLRDDPARGLGKPEALRQNLTGFWSRRLSRGDRLMYQFDDDHIGIFAKGHSKGSFHGKNLAIDVAGPKFNKLSHEKAKKAALKAGFTHDVYEDFKGDKRDHWHFQIGSGNGLTDKHLLSNKTLTIKKKH